MCIKKKALKIANNWKKTHPNNLFASYAISALEGENIVNNQIFDYGCYKIYNINSITNIIVY